MNNTMLIKQVRHKYQALKGDLDERGRRRWAATEATALGWGGIGIVSKASGISPKTISTGIKELNSKKQLEKQRQRVLGGGRKSFKTLQPKLAAALDQIIEPTTRGDPVSPLRWTYKSTRTIANILREQGFFVSHATVKTMLQNQGYSLQANRKTNEGGKHPDRNKQFEFLNRRLKAFKRAKNPAISVDAKKKEVLGCKKNSGTIYCKKRTPTEVDVYDFIDDKLGKAVPYGVYDIGLNEAGVSIGINHDTAEFAVAAICRWWKKLGKKRYPCSNKLLITADCGGSNGYKNRLWKLELQKLADRTGLIIEVSHLPPGTSKWNKIEHRLFCHITRNWQGIPLETLEVVVQLIGNTRTVSGLEVHAWLDNKKYEKGKKISEKKLSECIILKNSFHGEWNYEIIPRKNNK